MAAATATQSLTPPAIAAGARSGEAQAVATGDMAVPSLVLPIGTSMAEAERALVLATLRHYNHHKERTAAVLGISL